MTSDPARRLAIARGAPRWPSPVAAAASSDSSTAGGGAYGGGGDHGDPASDAAPKAPRRVTVATVPKLGKVIVDSDGFTLYDFHKDKGTTRAATAAAPASGRR